MKSVKHLKTSRKAYLIKMLPISMESHPIEFRLGSKIKGSMSKLWKTIVPAKNEWLLSKNNGSCQNGVKTFK